MEYNFNEKKVENIKGIECPVWQTPKYIESKKKAIELIESNKYGLTEADFWTLINTYAKGTKAMYTGLIISHNGCLKINDKIDNKVDPTCFEIDKQGYANSLVVAYKDRDTFEIGEVNTENCSNDYKYAMALKRCFDRVVLKKSRIAYAGIYSEDESEEFTKKYDDNAEQEAENKIKKLQDELKQICSDKKLDLVKTCQEYKISAKSTEEDLIQVIEMLNK